MKQGLARLAELERARLLEMSARHMEGRANMYSTEHQWVTDSYRLAREQRAEAERLRRGDGEEYNGY